VGFHGEILGHRVITASSVAQALRLLSCLRFDVLVSDIALPDGSGLELVAEAKKRQRFKKAVALTGLGQPEDRERRLRAGFDEYLTKPIDLYQLCAVLDQRANRNRSNLKFADGHMNRR